MKKKINYLILLIPLHLSTLLCSCSDDPLDYEEDMNTFNTKIIAHRGYWNYDGCVENSISSLINAQKLGIYGSEFDVWVTSDKIPIVHHENKIEGFIIENTPFSTFEKLRLANGEKIPTLEDYLLQGKESVATKLILEIKTYRSIAREDSAVTIILNMVHNLNLESQVEYISFSYNACNKVIKKNPNAIVYYLGGNMIPKDIKSSNFTGIAYNFKIIKENSNWLSEAFNLKLKTNIWVVNDDNLMNELINQKVDYITTDKPIELIKAIRKLNIRD